MSFSNISTKLSKSNPMILKDFLRCLSRKLSQNIINLRKLIDLWISRKPICRSNAKNWKPKKTTLRKRYQKWPKSLMNPSNFYARYLESNYITRNRSLKSSLVIKNRLRFKRWYLQEYWKYVGCLKEMKSSRSQKIQITKENSRKKKRNNFKSSTKH